MKMLEIIEEQILQKMKDKLSDVGKKITNIPTKIVQTPKSEPNPDEKKYISFVEKYKNINQNLDSNMIFVEGNDGGNSNMLLNRLKMNAISIYTKREFQKNPQQSTYSKTYSNVRAVDWSCFSKLNENGNVVTQCAYLFEIIP